MLYVSQCGIKIKIKIRKGNKMTNHVSDGISYSKPKIYKCKTCGTRLTSEEYRNTTCEDFEPDVDSGIDMISEE